MADPMTPPPMTHPMADPAVTDIERLRSAHSLESLLVRRGREARRETETAEGNNGGGSSKKGSTDHARLWLVNMGSNAMPAPSESGKISNRMDPLSMQ